MSEKSDEKSLYWTIVGADVGTGTGTARLLGVIVVLIVLAGAGVWLVA